MKVIFNEFALEELADSIEYYEIELKGLGKQFKNEVKKAIKRIVKYPQAGSIVAADIRKHLLLRFPFKILYSIEDGYIYIIAIAHHHRKPNFWIDRS